MEITTKSLRQFSSLIRRTSRSYLIFKSRTTIEAFEEEKRSSKVFVSNDKSDYSYSIDQQYFTKRNISFFFSHSNSEKFRSVVKSGSDHCRCRSYPLYSLTSHTFSREQDSRKDPRMLLINVMGNLSLNERKEQMFELEQWPLLMRNVLIMRIIIIIEKCFLIIIILS